VTIDLPTVGLVLLLIALPLNWYATYHLVRIDRHLSLPALHERAMVAVILSTVLTALTVLTLNAGLGYLVIDFPGTLVIRRFALVAIAVPALYWLWVYRRRD